MKRLLMSLVLSATAALILAALRWTTPSYDALTGPFPVAAAVGEPAQARTFTITASKISFARRLRFKSGGVALDRDTDGIWAVVEATIEATTATMSVGSAEWEGPGGLRFAQSQRVEGAPGLFAARRLQPGLPQRGIFVFEVAPDQARDATLIVSQMMAPRLDSQIRIALRSNPDNPVDALDLDEPAR